MKNLKSKLLASIAMLIVATIMMTSASFAWFTISTAPEITGITTTVTANGNLEIALDDGNKRAPADSAVTNNVGDYGKNETWGNLVDLNDYFSTANVVLKPVDLDETSGAVKIPTWGLDGRIKELVAATETNVTTEHLKGIVTYTDGADQNPSTYAIRVDFWLRSNVAGTISLSTAKDRGTGESAGAGSTLTGDGWNEHIKVAFQPNGTGALTTATRADNGALTATVLTLEAADVNKPKLVSMYLYMDGAALTNANFLNEAKALALNIQFAHSANLIAMDVNASNPAT